MVVASACAPRQTGTFESAVGGGKPSLGGRESRYLKEPDLLLSLRQLLLQTGKGPVQAALFGREAHRVLVGLQLLPLHLGGVCVKAEVSGS